MYYVYLLQSLKRDFMYVGCTSNLPKRCEEHHLGVVQSTRGHRPLRLIYYEAYLAQQDAVNREQRLKHHGSVIGHLKKRLQNSAASPKRAGQALIEFAVFGSLALLALAFMIQIGLRANYQQEIDQQTFRRALDVADSYSDIEPVSVSYLQFRDRQIPDPSEGFGIMPRAATTGQAEVVWGTYLGFADKDDRRSQPLTIVRVNNAEREFRSDDFKNAPDDLPLYTRIDRTLTSAGTIRQTRQPNAESSSLATRTTQTTTVTLKNDAKVSSSVSSGVNWNW